MRLRTMGNKICMSAGSLFTMQVSPATHNVWKCPMCTALYCTLICYKQENCVAVTIWRLATNIEYKTIAELYELGISTVCNIDCRTTSSITRHLLPLSSGIASHKFMVGHSH